MKCYLLQCMSPQTALPRHAVIANSGQLTRQERSRGRCRRKVESDPSRTSGLISTETASSRQPLRCQCAWCVSCSQQCDGAE